MKISNQSQARNGRENGCEMSGLRRGFTLIEILVVITIIAILASLAIPVTNKVVLAARKAEAKAALTGLVSAVSAYQLDYSKLPNVTGGNADVEQETTKQFMEVLFGTENTSGGGTSSSVLNPRKTRYMDAKYAKNDAGGIRSNGDFVDPWGQLYLVVLDTNYDGQITNPANDGLANEDILVKEVVALSWGNDNPQKPGRRSDKAHKDIIRSWK